VTGFSSLSYLRRLPVGVVKIDRTFISGIDQTAKSGAIVKAVLDLTHALGLIVTAEGVETEVQRDRTFQLGCDQAQGFFYAKPMPAAVLSSHLRAPDIHSLHLPA
jgi:diguanylate cyclase